MNIKQSNKYKSISEISFHFKHKLGGIKKQAIYIFLSIFLFISNISPTYAQVNGQSYTTGYGSYYYTYTTELTTYNLLLGNLNIAGVGYQATLKYQFNKAYTGSIEVKALTQDIWNRANVYTNNCWVYGKNSSNLTYTINFTNVDYIEVAVCVPTQTAITSMSGQLIQLTNNYSLTDGVDLEDIYSSIGVVDGTIPTMTTSLLNITTNTQDIEDLVNASRSLLNDIAYALRGNNTLFNLADMLQSMNTQYIQMNTYLQALNIPDYAQLIYRCLTNNNINNINNNAYGNYITVNSNTSYSTYLYGAGAPYCMIYGVNATNVYPVFDNANISVTVRRTTRTNGYIVNYVEIVNNSGSNGNFTFTFNNASTNRTIYPYFLGYTTNIPFDLQYATKGYYSDAYTNKIDDVIDAINNMELNVNNMTVNTTGVVYNVTSTEVNESITEYNENISYIYNVENNYSYLLSDYIDDYNPTFNINNQNIDYTNANSIIAPVYNELGNDKLIGTTIKLVLLGLVLIAIVG